MPNQNGESPTIDVMGDRRRDSAEDFHSLPRNAKLHVDRELSCHPRLMSQSTIVQSTPLTQRFRDFTPTFSKLRQGRRQIAKKISSGASKFFRSRSKPPEPKTDRSRLGKFLQETKETEEIDATQDAIPATERFRFAPADTWHALPKMGPSLEIESSSVYDRARADTCGKVEGQRLEQEVEVEINDQDNKPEPDDIPASFKRCHSTSTVEANRIFKLTEEIQKEENLTKDGEWQTKLERWASSLEEAIRVINREQGMKRKMAVIERDRIILRNQMNSLLSDREQWKQKCAIMERKLINVAPIVPWAQKLTNDSPITSNLPPPLARSTSVPRSLADNLVLNRMRKPPPLLNNNLKINDLGTSSCNNNNLVPGPQSILDWQTALLVQEIRQLEQHVVELNQKVDATSKPVKSVLWKNADCL